MSDVFVDVDDTAVELCDVAFRRLRPRREVHITFFRQTDPTPVVFAAGRNGDYIRSNIWTVYATNQ